jgi:hypothetical protein
LPAADNPSVASQNRLEAQSDKMAVLRGRITDPDGKSLGGAVVRLDQGGRMVSVTATDLPGGYQIPFAPDECPYDL